MEQLALNGAGVASFFVEWKHVYLIKFRSRSDNISWETSAGGKKGRSKQNNTLDMGKQYAYEGMEGERI